VERDLLPLCRFLEEGTLAVKDQNDLGDSSVKASHHTCLTPVRASEGTLLSLWSDAEPAAAPNPA
jgi:hypothetical protein